MTAQVSTEHKLFVPNKPYLIIFLGLLMTPLAGMGIDLYTPSMPAIAQYFQCNSSLVKLTLAMYLLGYGIGQPVFGTLSDCYGRRKFLLLSYFLFIMASFGCAYATNIHTLLLMRLLQGIAMAGSGTISKSMMTDCFSDQRLVNISTYMSIAWALGPIIAPAIGGYLQHYFGWQAAFYFYAIAGCVIFLLVLFAFPETNQNLYKLSVNSVLNAYKAILSHKIFIGSLLCMSIVYSLISIFNTLAPFLLQVKMQYSAIDYGHIALIMGLGYFTGSLTNRYLITKYMADRILRDAIVWMLGMSVLLLVLAYIFPLKLLAITIPIILVFYGTGFVFPICMAKCMSLFRHVAGSATAIMGCLFVVGTSLIAALASTFTEFSQMPLALSYVSLTIICWLIYRLMLVN